MFNSIVLFHFRYMLKPLKQKLFVDGLSYLLQEIYGLENKVALLFIQLFKLNLKWCKTIKNSCMNQKIYFHLVFPSVWTKRMMRMTTPVSMEVMVNLPWVHMMTMISVRTISKNLAKQFITLRIKSNWSSIYVLL